HTRVQGDWSSDVCPSDLRRATQIAPIIVTSALEGDHVSIHSAVLPRGKKRAGERGAGRGEGVPGVTELNLRCASRNKDGTDDIRSEERRVGKRAALHGLR